MNKSYWMGALCVVLCSITVQAHASVVFNFTIDVLQPASVNTMVGDKFSITFVDDSNFLSGITSADFETISYDTNEVGSDSWAPSSIASSGFGLEEIFNFSKPGGVVWQLDLILGFTGTTASLNPWVNIVDGTGKNIQFSQFGAGHSGGGVFNFGIANNSVPSQQTMNNTSGSFTLSATAVPLPGAVWLLASGLLGLVGLSRHKKAT